MTIRTPWPWITMLLAAIVACNPIGFDILHSAFFSGEALSRNIWGPIVLTGVAIHALIGVLEWRIRASYLRRRGSGPTTA